MNVHIFIYMQIHANIFLILFTYVRLTTNIMCFCLKLKTFQTLKWVTLTLSKKTTAHCLKISSAKGNTLNANFSCCYL